MSARSRSYTGWDTPWANPYVQMHDKWRAWDEYSIWRTCSLGTSGHTHEMCITCSSVEVLPRILFSLMLLTPLLSWFLSLELSLLSFSIIQSHYWESPSVARSMTAYRWSMSAYIGYYSILSISDHQIDHIRKLKLMMDRLEANSNGRLVLLAKISNDCLNETIQTLWGKLDEWHRRV